MSSYRRRGADESYSQSNRPHPPSTRADFYDDRRSSSRSPDRTYSPPPRRRSPPHDIARSPPRGPAADSRYNGRDSRYYDRDSDRQHRFEKVSPSPHRGRDYRETDDEMPRPASYDSRSRSRSPGGGRRRPTSRGRPSKEIMMEGLAIHLTEDDISGELKQHYHVQGLEDVRIIRDRSTKASRQFGFLRFSTLDEAETFMDNNFPFIYLYGNADSNGKGDEAKVHVVFGRERKDPGRVDDVNWLCPNCGINNFPSRVRCFRCQALRPESAFGGDSKAANIGDNDASPDNTPSQFLLLRGLEASVTEELLLKGVSKLFKPSGRIDQPAQSSKKGAKVASTTGDANLGAKEGTLRRVLLVRDRRSNDSWRYGFAEYATIEDAQAALTRFNSYDRFTIASKQVLVSYIHAGVFVPVLNPTVSTERFTFSPLNNPALKLAYWDDYAYVTELVVSRPEPEHAPNAQHNAVPPAQREGFKSAKDDQKLKKRKAEAPAAGPTKKPASHLQYWKNRHAELHGLDQKSASPEDASKESNAPPSQTFTDPSRHCCYLCLRQFKDAAEANKHERLSELHRQNLKDEAKVQKALNKLEKHGIQITQSSGSGYRDRARERRKIYGVVNKKGEQVGPGTKHSSAASSDDEAEPAQPQSKGATLLSKMGYDAESGMGLGASGSGRTAPIEQNVYAAGVGLGAAGGKMGDAVEEAERNTKGDYAGFTERTKEKARERYASMKG